jgi:hypothetical protein
METLSFKNSSKGALSLSKQMEKGVFSDLSFKLRSAPF